MDTAQEIRAIKKSLANIEQMLKAAGAKKVMTVQEAALFLGMSADRLYHLVNARGIPFYRNGTKRIRFDRDELEVWLKQERIATDDELMNAAAEVTTTIGGKRWRG